MSKIPADVLAQCQAVLPAWRGLEVDDFDFADPKGFSSFTMGVRCHREVDPRAVLYRHLDGKENPMLDYEAEKHVYETLAAAGIATPLHVYNREHRIEHFYEGRTLTRHDLSDHEILGQIGQRLAVVHSLSPQEVPSQPFFDRLHERWSPFARRTLVDAREQFPEHEQEMCEELMPILEDGVLHRVRSLLPDTPLGFSHNDTYHGNIMQLHTGEVRLLDFEFSCLNHQVFDFSNLFAETVMRHQLAEYPYFEIAEPEYTADDIAALVEPYLAAGGQGEVTTLVEQTLQMIPLSDYMYANAALPLAVHPIQKIRFIPYALRRWRRFLHATES